MILALACSPVMHTPVGRVRPLDRGGSSNPSSLWRVFIPLLLGVMGFSASYGMPVGIRLDVEHVTGEMPLLGYNMTYARNGQLIVDNQGNFRPQRLQSLARIQPQWLRFPGGTISNTYDWKRAIGPVADREDQVHAFLFRLDPESSIFGPDEAAQFIETVGGELQMVISWNSTAAEAAALVEYMNARVGENPTGGVDWAAVRAENGRFEPYGVRYWAVGNEGGGRDIATWTSWPYDGDDIRNDGLVQGSAEARQWWRDGGYKAFTNQKAVLRSTWNDSGVRARGRANEVFYVKFPPVVPDSLLLRVGETPENATEWTQVDSLVQSGPEDQHFTFDPVTGRIEFGDGHQGAMLPRLHYIYVDYTTGPRDGMRQFYQAMKAVDPTIKVGAAKWTLAPSRTEDPTIPFDGWEAHGGFFLYSVDRINADPYWEAIARGAGTLPREKSDEWNRIKDFGNVRLDITEYTTLGNLQVGGIQYAHTIAGALHHALAIRAVSQAGHTQLMGPNYLYNNLQPEVVHVDDNDVVSAQGWAYALFTRYFGRTLVSFEADPVQGVSLPYRISRTESGTIEVPFLNFLASRDQNGLVCLMVINVDKDDAYTVEVDFGVKVIAPRYHVLASSDINGVNTVQHPDTIGIREGDEPIVIGAQKLSVSSPPASASVLTAWIDVYSESRAEEFWPNAGFEEGVWHTWWGRINHVKEGWVRSIDHGWSYLPESSGGWLWDSALGWLFVAEEIFPYVVSIEHGVLFYQEGSIYPDRRFYHFNSKKWTSETILSN